jgi:hypothetical protein
VENDCRGWSVSAAIATVVVAASFTAADAGLADPAPLEAAQSMFYNGRYAEAASASGKLCTDDVSALAACELRTSALLFQIRRAMGDGSDKDKAFAQCPTCPELLSAFIADTRRAQARARAHLKMDPEDHQTLFYLGKIDLSYIWLQLGTLGRKTGWDEYWEARRSIDSVLKQNPANVRAKVARAWIDYIVATRMPGGTRWLLGGGNKKRGLRAAREAADVADADLYVRAEAGFALWEMHVRERNLAEARVTAAKLARDFPANPELRKFLETHRPPGAQ